MHRVTHWHYIKRQSKGVTIAFYIGMALVIWYSNSR